MDVNVHGTYPFDCPRWRRVRALDDLQEVSDLLGLGLDSDVVTQHNESGYERSDKVYLWLNKGYVIIGDDAPQGVPSEGNMSLAMMEMFGGSPEVKDIRAGAQAVYLQDGSYILIERVA